MTESELRALWNSLPTVECKGLCSECCGPIGMNTVEQSVIEKFTGKPLKQVMRADVESSDDADTYCPYLRDKRCTIYEARPTICRVWGTFPKLACEHGCKVNPGLIDPEVAMGLIVDGEPKHVHTHPRFRDLMIKRYGLDN